MSRTAAFSSPTSRSRALYAATTAPVIVRKGSAGATGQDSSRLKTMFATPITVRVTQTAEMIAMLIEIQEGIEKAMESEGAAGLEECGTFALRVDRLTGRLRRGRPRNLDVDAVL